MRRQSQQRPEQYVRGALSSFGEWQQQNMKRLAFRALWERFFESVDVFLLPTTFTAAFPHDRTPPERRMIPMPEGGTYPFWNLLTYITPATLTGCPATTAPVGLSRSGLPVGLQIVGPYLEDATPIGFARLLARRSAASNHQRVTSCQPRPGGGTESPRLESMETSDLRLLIRRARNAKGILRAVARRFDVQILVGAVHWYRSATSGSIRAARRAGR